MPIVTGYFKKGILWALYGVLVFFAIDLCIIVFGKGVRLEVLGVSFRSTTIELPVIVILVSCFLILFFLERYKEIILVIGAFVVTAVVGEGLLHIIDHPFSKPFVNIARWYEPSEIFGHQLVKNFDGRGPLNVQMRTNSLGFRDKEMLSGETADERRILVLGDSFAMGWGVPYQEIFSQKLEVLLKRANNGKGVKVLNTGVPGWGLNQYYILLKELGDRFSANIVVLAYFLDDNSGSVLEVVPANQQYRGGVKYKGGVLHLSRLYNFSKSWADNIRHKNRATRVSYLHSLTARREEWGKREQYLMSSSGTKEQQIYRQQLFAHLERIKNLTSGQGAQLMLLYIPDVSQLHSPTYQYINQVLKEFAEELTIPFIDMTPIFQDSPDIQTYYLWPQDPHTNSFGHLKMAESLAKIICAPPSETLFSCGDS